MNPNTKSAIDFGEVFELDGRFERPWYLFLYDTKSDNYNYEDMAVCRLQVGQGRCIEISGVVPGSWQVLVWIVTGFYDLIYQWMPIEATLEDGIYCFDLEKQLTRMGIEHGQANEGNEEAFNRLKENVKDGGWVVESVFRYSVYATKYGFLYCNRAWDSREPETFVELHFAPGYTIGNYPVISASLYENGILGSALELSLCRKLNKSFMSLEDLKRMDYFSDLQWTIQFDIVGYNGGIYWEEGTLTACYRGGRKAWIFAWDRVVPVLLRIVEKDSDEDMISFVEELQQTGYCPNDEEAEVTEGE